jgi:hypothetical protein
MENGKSAVQSTAIISGIVTLLVPVADQLSQGALGPKGVAIGMALGTILQIIGRLKADKVIVKFW